MIQRALTRTIDPKRTRIKPAMALGDVLHTNGDLHTRDGT
jgi:hypothetical protein